MNYQDDDDNEDINDYCNKWSSIYLIFQLFAKIESVILLLILQ